MGKFAFNARIFTIFTIKNSSYFCLQQWSTDILGHKGQSWKVELLYIAIFYPDLFYYFIRILHLFEKHHAILHLQKLICYL